MPKKTLCVLSVLLLAAWFTQAQATMSHNARGEIAVQSDAPGSKALLSVTQVQTMLSDGRSIDGSIIALFDATNRLFWWMHLTSVGPADPDSVRKEFLNSYTFSVYPEQIVCFVAQGRTLWVRTSHLHVSSLDEGLAKVQSTLSEELEKFVSGETMWFHEIPLAQSMGQTFFRPKNFGDPAVRLRIGTVERSASGWRVEVRNDKGESKMVTLNKDFKAALGDTR
jgi:hypothetical protein